MKKKTTYTENGGGTYCAKVFRMKEIWTFKILLDCESQVAKCERTVFCIGLKSIRTTSNRVYCESMYVFGISSQRRLHSKLNSLFLRKVVWLEFHTARYAIILFHSTLLFFDSPALFRFLLFHFLFNFVTSVRNSFDILYSPIITHANSLFAIILVTVCAQDEKSGIEKKRKMMCAYIIYFALKLSQTLLQINRKKK